MYPVRAWDMGGGEVVQVNTAPRPPSNSNSFLPGIGTSYTPSIISHPSPPRMQPSSAAGVGRDRLAGRVGMINQSVGGVK